MAVGPLVVSLGVGVAVACALALVAPRSTRLAQRVRPYTVASRTSLGRSADVMAVAEPGPIVSGGTLRRLVEPLLRRAATALGGGLGGGDELLAIKLRQAGLFPDVPADRRPQEYRVRQLAGACAFTVVFAGAGVVGGGSAGLVLVLAVLGAVAGVARWRGRVDRAIEQRRQRMRIELYTVNQLLALHVRVGGGVVQALQRVSERGNGDVVNEVRELLRSHRGGRPLASALEQAAKLTPEPNAARTYKLMATGVTYGADLAEGLRALSEDIRDQRAETIKRVATARRAAMLMPIILVLAPIMLLFIAAPLPSIVLGGR